MMYDLKVFLMEEAKVQLEDDFVDKEDDLRHFIYEQVKGLAKSGKMIKLNGQFIANIEDENAPERKGQETIKLKEFDLDKYDVKSDPDWVPENLDSEEATVYKIRVGEKTWKLLQIYFQIYQARVSIFNKSVNKKRKGFNEDVELAKTAKCTEQIIHEALIGPVMQKISLSIDKDLEEEFTEVYKSKSEKTKEIKKKRSGKKNQE